MHEHNFRPRLSPAVADVRRAVRELLSAAAVKPVLHTEEEVHAKELPLILVALSGGADSLALANATAFVAPRLGLRAGAIIVDHAIQEDSASVARQAAQKARSLGLDPVLIDRVQVAPSSSGPEAAARAARYASFERAVQATGAAYVLLGHTLDDQAETVLLGLARGSGPTSVAGMSEVTGRYLRPLLRLRRTLVHQSCLDAQLAPWHDPHNDERTYRRVRVRQNVLPVLESELGPGIALSLARTAEQLREDSSALDTLAQEALPTLAIRAENLSALDAKKLAALPAALAQRVVRAVALADFGCSLSRAQTIAVLALVTDWHGQKGCHLPGIRVHRNGDQIIFVPQQTEHSLG